MRTAMAAVWAVIVSTLLLQAGSGLQTDLISVRADAEGFGAAMIGPMMAAYYIGYASAPFAGRWVVSRLGHVWTIAACSLAAAAIISLQPILVTIPAWTGLRAASGFALSLSYVAYESWINDAVPNAQRGRVFSIYMFAQMIGMTLAQIVFARTDPASEMPFLFSAVLFVLAAAPGAVTRRAAHSAVPPKPLGVASLFHLSALGAGAVVVAGLSWAIIFTFGPIYARHEGFDASSIGLFMGVSMVAGSVLQVPLGWLSDHIGRRPVLAIMFGVSLLACLLGIWATDRGEMMNLVVIAFAGGFSFPIYAIAVAHVNDHLSAETRVAAAAGLVLLFGVGSVFGPLLTGPAMAAIGATGFFLLLSATMAGGVVLALRYR